MSPDDYEMLSKQMDKGFTLTHTNIADLKEDFQLCQGRQATLFERVVEVEKQQAVDKAIEDKEEKQEGKKWDVWKLIIRSAIACSVPMMAGILGMLIWLSQNIKIP